jgi:hypothetical protein
MVATSFGSAGSRFGITPAGARMFFFTSCALLAAVMFIVAFDDPAHLEDVTSHIVKVERIAAIPDLEFETARGETTVVLGTEAATGNDLSFDSFTEDVTTILHWMQKHQQLPAFTKFKLRIAGNDENLFISFAADDMKSINLESMSSVQLLNMTSTSDDRREAQSLHDDEFRLRLVYVNGYSAPIVRRYCNLHFPGAALFCQTALGAKWWQSK